jgi:hypothetical protein
LKILKSIGLVFALLAIVFLGFVNPGLFICRWMFGGWMFIIFVFAMAFAFLGETVVDEMKSPGLCKREVYEKMLHESKFWRFASIMGWVAYVGNMAMLIYGNYPNTAVLYTVLLCAFAASYRSLKTIVKGRLAVIYAKLANESVLEI